MSHDKRELADRSDELLAALQTLHETEALKRQEEISTPPFHELAEEVTRQSRQIFEIARQQEQIGDEVDQGESIDDLSTEAR